MNKNTGRRIATTFNLSEAMHESWDMEDVAFLLAPYVWPTVEQAEVTINRMISVNGFDYVQYEIPGLSVFAVTDRSSHVQTVIVIEDVTVVKLSKAIRHQRPVTIGYTKQYDGESTVRTVEPSYLRLTKDGNVTMGGRDRRSGEYRSFRVDKIVDYTVHRSAFTVDETRVALISRIRETEKAKKESVKVDAIAEGSVRVESIRRGFTGRTVPGTLGAGTSGWSVVVDFDFEHAHRTPTGTARLDVKDLRILPDTTEDIQRSERRALARQN